MFLNRTKLKDVTICEITLNPQDNSTYSGSIKIIGNMENFSVGDTVTIQTSNNKKNYNSMIKGIITGRDFTTNTLFSSHIETLAE